MSVTPEEVTEQPHAGPGFALAAFYERRAPAALAYCARVCPPEAVTGAMEASFARALAEGVPDDLDELETRLRSALRAEAADRCVPHDEEGERRRFARGSVCARTSRMVVARAAGELSDGELESLESHLYTCPDCRALERRFEEAERSFDSLAGDDAPALGRSLVAELAARLELEANYPDPPTPPAPPDPATAAFPQPPPPPAAIAGSDRRTTLGAHARAAYTGTREGIVPVLARARRALPHLGPVARRRIAIALLVIGVLLLAEVAVTAIWEEPLTAYLTSKAQADLSKQLGALDRATAGGGVRARLAGLHNSNARMSLLAEELSRTTPAGNALGDLRIPRIGIDYVVVQGTGAPALRKGPGHYRSTALPGEGGTVAIAGHRTTYEAPFRDIDQLKPGDRLILKMPYGLFTYAVTGHRIVPAGAHPPTGAGDSVVLSACHPRFSATHRILVSATLVSKQPLGAAVVPAAAAPAKHPARTPSKTASRLVALGSRELQQGLRGPDVKELQRLLGVPSTGYFGYDTQAAVIAFQQSHNITPADGHVGSQTKKALARRPHAPSVPPTPANVAPQNTQTTPQGTTTTSTPRH